MPPRAIVRRERPRGASVVAAPRSPIGIGGRYGRTETETTGDAPPWNGRPSLADDLQAEAVADGPGRALEAVGRADAPVGAAARAQLAERAVMAPDLGLQRHRDPLRRQRPQDASGEDEPLAVAQPVAVDVQGQSGADAHRELIARDALVAVGEREVHGAQLAIGVPRRRPVDEVARRVGADRAVEAPRLTLGLLADEHRRVGDRLAGRRGERAFDRRALREAHLALRPRTEWRPPPADLAHEGGRQPRAADGAGAVGDPRRREPRVEEHPVGVVADRPVVVDDQSCDGATSAVRLPATSSR